MDASDTKRDGSSMDRKPRPHFEAVKFRKFRVLIVEDNPVDRELLKAHLEDMGFANVQQARHVKLQGLWKSFRC
jgi:hypothetical protein